MNDTFLHAAARSNNKDIVKFIVDKKLVNIDEKNNAGLKAADVGNSEIKKLFESI